MSRTKHTPEPWRADGPDMIEVIGNNGLPVATLMRPRKHDFIPIRGEATANANARRIVACVNACEGITTEALEGGAVKELREALTRLADRMADTIQDMDIPEEKQALEAADSAIAKAGGKP